MIHPETPKRAQEPYQAEVEAEFHSILNFWQKTAPDPQRGGFIGRMRGDGTVDTEAPKGGILNARILWTFAAAFNHGGNAVYLTVAHRAFHYLTTHFFDPQFGGIYWSVTPDGQPLDTKKQTYALAFVVYGLSEYARALQSRGLLHEAALKIATELFGVIEGRSFDPERGGYVEAFARNWSPLPDQRLSAKDRNDPKTMNTHLHVLEAYANLYRVWPDAHLRGQLAGLIRIFLEKIIAPETGHLRLFFETDWQPTSAAVSYGHDIEAAWLLVEAAEVLGDEVLLERVKTAAIRMARAATEGLQPDGSLIHEVDPATGHVDAHREWWVQAEAMVGFLNAYELTGEEAFLTHSLNAWRYTQENLLDRSGGEWIWGRFADGSPMVDENKIGFWKCPYHNARACLEVARRGSTLPQIKRQTSPP